MIYTILSYFQIIYSSSIIYKFLLTFTQIIYIVFSHLFLILMDSDGQEIQFELISSKQNDDYQQDEFNHYNGNSITHFFYTDDQKQSKQDAPTGILSDQPYQLSDQSYQYQQVNKNKEGLFKMRNQKVKNYIEITRKTKQKYIICKKGNKRQTSLLNINFKNYLSALLKQYLLLHRTTSYEQRKINQFFASKANFGSFQKLYGIETLNSSHTQNSQIGLKQKPILTIKSQHDKLRKFLLNRFQNGEFVQKIMLNKKMSYQNKISLMKFASQIRKSCVIPQNFNNWKTSNNC